MPKKYGHKNLVYAKDEIEVKNIPSSLVLLLQARSNEYQSIVGLRLRDRHPPIVENLDLYYKLFPRIFGRDTKRFMLKYKKGV